MMRPLVRRGAVLLIAGLALCGLVRSADEEKPVGKLPADLALVPRDAAGFVTLRVGDLAAQPVILTLLGLLKGDRGPLEELQQVTGMAPAAIERVTVVLHGANEPVLVVRTKKPYDRAALVKHLREPEEKTVAGKTVLVSMKARFLDTAWPADATTLVLGHLREMTLYLARLARSGKAHVLADELKVAGKHSLVVALRPGLLMQRADAEMRAAREKFRFKDKMKGPPRELKKDAPPIRDKDRDFKDKDKASRASNGRFEFVSARIAVQKDGTAGGKDAGKEEPKLRDVGDILDESGLETLALRPFVKARRILITVDLGAEVRGAARLHYTSEDDAKDGVVGVNAALYLTREVLPIGLREAGLDPKAKPTAELIRGLQKILRTATVTRDGTTVQASLKAKLEMAGLAKFLAERALFVRDANNLKQIVLAFHNYESSYGHLPPPAILSKDGKPLLSWRVAILPFIEEDKLYRQFRLDEAWDSPHNKKLLDKMPKLYAPVVGVAPEPSSTCYQLFTGPNTPFPTPGHRARIVTFTDGTSNTILVAEASRAVPWTKPEDIAVEAKKPIPKLGGQFKRVLHVAFADGSVRLIRRTVEDKVLRIFIDPKDGRVIDFDKLKP